MGLAIAGEAFDQPVAVDEAVHLGLDAGGAQVIVAIVAEAAMVVFVLGFCAAVVAVDDPGAVNVEADGVCANMRGPREGVV